MINLKENVDYFYNKIKPVKIIKPDVALNNISREIIIHLIDNGINVADIDKILVKALQKRDTLKFKIYYMSKLKDKPRCQICSSEKDLELHHIKPKNSYPELEYKLDNVTLLCSTCHNLLHVGGNKTTLPEYRNKIKKQFNKMLDDGIKANED